MKKLFYIPLASFLLASATLSPLYAPPGDGEDFLSGVKLGKRANRRAKERKQERKKVDAARNLQRKHVAVAHGAAPAANPVDAGPAAARILTPEQEKMQARFKVIKREAQRRRVELLVIKGDPAAAQQQNEDLIRDGDLEAQHNRVVGYAEGKFGYPKDLARARQHNEDLIRQKDAWAIKRRDDALEGFIDFCYPKDGTEAARLYNEGRIAQGDSKAEIRRITGQGGGVRSFGYPQDHALARQYNEELIAQGKTPEALNTRVYGHATGVYGYPQDHALARQYNEELIAQKNKNAIQEKLNQLRRRKYKRASDEFYDYEQSKHTAEDLRQIAILNDMLVALEDPVAIKWKMDPTPLIGYTPQETNQFVETLAQQDQPDAVARKICALAAGESGYPQNPAAARAYTEFLLQKYLGGAYAGKSVGVVGASAGATARAVMTRNEVPDLSPSQLEAKKRVIALKVEGLTKGMYGFSKSSEELQAFIETLVAQRDPEGIRLKREGLREGKNGYNKDFKAFVAFNRALVLEDDPEAIGLEIHQLSNGWENIVYSIIPEAIALNEFYIKKADLRESLEGNLPALPRPVTHIDELLQKWNIDAIVTVGTGPVVSNGANVAPAAGAAAHRAVPSVYDVKGNETVTPPPAAGAGAGAAAAASSTSTPGQAVRIDPKMGRSPMVTAGATSAAGVGAGAATDAKKN